MQEEVMRPDEAWQAYRLLRSDRRIGYRRTKRTSGNLAGLHRRPIELAKSVDRRVPLRVRPRRSIRVDEGATADSP